MAAHGLKRARPAELVPGTLSVITARMDYLPRDTPPDWVDHEWARLQNPGEAIVSVYAQRLLATLKGLPTGDAVARRFTANVLIGFLPAALLGFLFIGVIKSVLFNPIVVATSFIVNFSIPYLLYSAGLSSRVGFIFAGIISLAVVFTYFCVPECKGKSLEQIDRMFNEGISLRKFGGYAPEEAVRDESGADKGVSSVSSKHEEKV